MSGDRLILTVGELVLDWIAKDFGVGFIEASTFVKSLGGNAANVAIALQRLGTQARILAKIGADVHGRYLLKVLTDEGVDTSAVLIDPNNVTAQCYVFTTFANDNTFLNWPPGNAAHKLDGDDIDPVHFQSAQALHATGISLIVEPRKAAVLKSMQLARENDIAVSFDAGFPTGQGEGAIKAVEDALALAHIVKVNLPELLFWSKYTGEDLSDIPADAIDYYEKPPSSGHESAVDLVHLLDRDRVATLARALAGHFKPDILLVTMADRGSLLLAGKHQIWTEAFPVETVAGVGAGDAYVAGFLHRLLSLSGKERLLRLVEDPDPERLTRAARYASAVGAIATTSLSAHEGLPRAADVDRLLSTCGKPID
ncbi:MAG: sugar kinase [Candidatus Melainabacteria bacterium]|nr:sugar kinase [Candidatus Melainabacteria bacterium]